MANRDDPPPRLMTLEEWARAHYTTPPSVKTLRRWCREARIYPAPRKHGRAYFVHPDAHYIDPANPEAYDFSWMRKE